MQTGHRRAYAALALLPSLAMIAGAASCGGDPQSEPLPSGQLFFETLGPDTNARTQIARVNGVSIFADCVVRQATASGITAEEAMEECVDF
ncbi:MAG: hypothetical protein JKY56_07925 [Kofleriaceae bacterium]|nr:hypothetical protein [Kofleriaceae bacterium]